MFPNCPCGYRTGYTVIRHLGSYCNKSCLSWTISDELDTPPFLASVKREGGGYFMFSGFNIFLLGCIFICNNVGDCGFNLSKLLRNRVEK